MVGIVDVVLGRQGHATVSGIGAVVRSREQEDVVGGKEERDVSPVSGGWRRRERPWPAGMGAALMMVMAGIGFVREREIGNLRGLPFEKKGVRAATPFFHVIGSAYFCSLHHHLYSSHLSITTSTPVFTSSTSICHVMFLPFFSSCTPTSYSCTPSLYFS